MNESHGAFIFMEENRENSTENNLPTELNGLSSKNPDNWWKPVLFFYVKTTSWIIFPLLVGVLGGVYVSKSTGSQILFFICMMLGFGVTCFGIYREIKNYKKLLDVPSRTEIEERLNNIKR